MTLVMMLVLRWSWYTVVFWDQRGQWCFISWWSYVGDDVGHTLMTRWWRCWYYFDDDGGIFTLTIKVSHWWWPWPYIDMDDCLALVMMLAVRWRRQQPYVDDDHKDLMLIGIMILRWWWCWSQCWWYHGSYVGVEWPWSPVDDDNGLA